MIKKILSLYDKEKIIEHKSLSFIFVKLNSMCNAKCPFCPSWLKKEDNNKLNIEHLAEELVKQKPLEVNLSGGEVFVSKDFWPLLEMVNGRVNWSITTNGSSMSESVIDRLVKYKVKRLFISIDSYIEEENDASRGIKNLLSKVVKGIKYIKAKNYDMTIIVNHVVTNKNCSEIDSFLIYMREIGVDAINLIPIKDSPDNYLTVQQIKDFYNRVNDKLDNGTISKDFFINGYYQIFGNKQSDYEIAATGGYNYLNKNNCIMAYNTLFIDCESGAVFPCDTTIWRENRNDYVLGNLITSTLEEIWNSECIDRFRKKMYPTMEYKCYQCCDPNNQLL